MIRSVWQKSILVKAWTALFAASAGNFYDLEIRSWKELISLDKVFMAELKIVHAWTVYAN
jgi:hypothetical protein